MSEEKKIFYKTLNNIVATNRIDNEESYILNNYISCLESALQQKENIIKEAREKVNTIQFEVRSNDKKYSNLYITLKSILQGQELLEILDKEVN